MKFDLKNFVKLDVNALLAINGGTSCSSSYSNYSSYSSASGSSNGQGSSTTGNYGASSRGSSSGGGSCNGASDGKTIYSNPYYNSSGKGSASSGTSSGGGTCNTADKSSLNNDTNNNANNVKTEITYTGRSFVGSDAGEGTETYTYHYSDGSSRTTKTEISTGKTIYSYWSGVVSGSNTGSDSSSGNGNSSQNGENSVSGTGNGSSLSGTNNSGTDSASSAGESSNNPNGQGSSQTSNNPGGSQNSFPENVKINPNLTASLNQGWEDTKDTNNYKMRMYENDPEANTLKTGDLLSKMGCKMTGAAKIANDIFTNLVGEKVTLSDVSKDFDTNKDALITMGEISNGINDKLKDIGIDNLVVTGKRLEGDDLSTQVFDDIKKGTDTTYVLGYTQYENADGSMGEHWVVLEGISINDKGEYIFSVDGTSKFDASRVYGYNLSDDSTAREISRIEVYTLKQK